jgi:hypothetical protein
LLILRALLFLKSKTWNSSPILVASWVSLFSNHSIEKDLTYESDATNLGMPSIIGNHFFATFTAQATIQQL